MVVGEMAGMQSRATAAERARLWGLELLEELLPHQPKRGTPVLLACDDEIVRVVGEQLGHGGEAVASFAGDVKLAFHIGPSTGLGRVLAGPFRQLPRPRPMPDFFPVLCLLVLAASRMAPDERSATQAYYRHLRELLDMSGHGELEDIEFVPGLFGCMADWLAEDLDGARGRLVLPHDPWPRYVGVMVSQTVFRRRDRQVLSRFFSERGRAGLEGYDPVRRLRRWPGRHSMTAHALQVLHDDSVASQVRAAIVAAHRSWDGAILDDTPSGVGRYWPATLHLFPYPPRLHLSAGNTREVVFRLDGPPVLLQPGGEVQVPFSLLQRMRSGPLVLGDPRSSSGALRVPALHDTAVFELTPDGMLHTERPSAETVWALTCDPALQRRLAQHRFRESVLPVPWQLLREVPTAGLPGIERAAAPRAMGEFRLEGGLPLERGVYLSGRGPVLVAGDVDADERLPVVVNGQQRATIASGERVRIPGEPGSYLVAIGEEWRTSYDVERHGEPGPCGALAHGLSGGRALRSGARPVSEEDGSAATVCGAIVSIPYGHDRPILTRVSAELQTIDLAGELARHRRPPTPPWLYTVGLGESARERWEIVREGVVWLLCAQPGFGNPWARLQRDALPEWLSAEAAALVVEVAERGVRASPQEAWSALLGKALTALAGSST